MRDKKESIENYLETILVMSETMEKIRSVDLAKHLGYSKPSISVALKKLKDLGYVDVSKGGSINLTESGEKLAKNIYSRHNLLTDFFISIGVSEDVAVKDACTIEHFLSQETVDRIHDYYNKKYTK